MFLVSVQEHRGGGARRFWQCPNRSRFSSGIASLIPTAAPKRFRTLLEILSVPHNCTPKWDHEKSVEDIFPACKCLMSDFQAAPVGRDKDLMDDVHVQISIRQFLGEFFSVIADRRCRGCVSSHCRQAEGTGRRGRNSKKLGHLNMLFEFYHS